MSNHRVDEYNVTVRGNAQPGDKTDTAEHQYQDTVRCSGDRCDIQGYVAPGGPGDNWIVEGGISRVNINRDIHNNGGSGTLQVWVNGEGPFDPKELEGVGMDSGGEAFDDPVCMRDIA